MYKFLCNKIQQLNGCRQTCAIVLLNFANYGICCFLFLVCYLAVCFVLQEICGFDAMISTVSASIVFSIASVILYLLFRKRGVKAYQSFSELKFRRILPWSIYALFVMYMILMLFHWTLLRMTDDGMAVRSETFQNMPFWFYLLYSVLIAPVTEECMFRLFMYNQLKRTSSWILSMIVVSFVFALIHNTVTHMMFAFLFSVFLILSYEINGSPVVNIVYHVIYNSLALVYVGIEPVIMNNFIVPALGLILIIVFSVQILLLNQKMKSYPYKDWQ